MPSPDQPPIDRNQPPLVWLPGTGFMEGKKKLALPANRLVGVSSPAKQAAPVDPKELRLEIQAFLRVNHVLLGFIAWNGYAVDRLGAGVVYCDASESGIDAEVIGAQYVPAQTILDVLRQQGIDEAMVLTMDRQLQEYNPAELMFVIVALQGFIFPVALQEEGLFPPECYRLVQAPETPVLEEEGNA